MLAISLSLFLIGLLGFLLKRSNLLIMLISIELMLLAVGLLLFTSALILDEATGLILGLVVITMAAVEAALGLGILVSYYRLRGQININNTSN